MAAYELALQNFAVAEHLLQLYDLFRGLQEKVPTEEFRLAVCRELACPEETNVRESHKEDVLLLTKTAAPFPQALLLPDGMGFLLRNAVIVSCTAVESFFWDSLRENVLTIVKARRRRADKSLRDLTFTLDDYLSIENYTDPDERLQDLILKNFERRTLYDSDSIERIGTTLTVKAIWDDVGRICKRSPSDMRRDIDDLIGRRNKIAHRADRPDPGEERDSYDLRVIDSAWMRLRFATAKSLVDAANSVFSTTIRSLQEQLARDREQELARQTLRPAAAVSPQLFVSAVLPVTPDPPSAAAGSVPEPPED